MIRVGSIGVFTQQCTVLFCYKSARLKERARSSVFTSIKVCNSVFVVKSNPMSRESAKGHILKESNSQRISRKFNMWAHCYAGMFLIISPLNDFTVEFMVTESFLEQEFEFLQDEFK